MKDEYSYIEFEISTQTRFACFKRLFNKLKSVKNSWMQDTYLEQKRSDSSYRDPVDSFPWHDYLDEDAKKWFNNTFDFNNEEGIIYWKLWELTEPEIRLKHPFFKTPGNWYFESMLDAIFNGDYSLIDLIREKGDRGCLYYNPHAYPFGGSRSLVELISSFGNQVTYDSWHKKNSPIHQSEWNFELAKVLVKQGVGFTPELLNNRNT